MKSEIRNPKSEINPKPKFSKSKICFGHLNFGNSKLFRISIFDIRIFTLIFIFSFTILMTGCESLAKKFIRKPKGPPKKEEPVIVPQTYAPMPAEQAYRQYFLYWKSWHDELINALTDSGNQKKRVASAERVLEHLENMRNYLNEETQEKLDKHIQIVRNMSDQIKDANIDRLIMFRVKTKLEKEKIIIDREFNYSKIKNKLKQ